MKNGTEKIRVEQDVDFRRFGKKKRQVSELKSPRKSIEAQKYKMLRWRKIHNKNKK